MIRVARPVLLACLSFLLGTALRPVRAQEEHRDAGSSTPSLRALRLPPDGGSGAGDRAAISVDGLLDEPAWTRADAASGFRQREPDEGDPASERTEVRVAYDDRALYVGVVARGEHPDGVIARILKRDRIMEPSPFGSGLLFGGDDAVAVLLDTFHDHRNAVVFATNPNGAKFEALVTDEGEQMNVEWRGVWRVEARRIPAGWSAEFEIPFRTLRYPEDGSGDGTEAGLTWGFNVMRAIRRRNETALWTSWSRENEGFTRVSRAGHLRGLRELPRPGLNMEVKPSLLTRATEDVRPGGGSVTGVDAEVGGDVKYEIRPGLVLDLTVNPDFAQVEVDEERVNLTRFSLFFPEKRDFFLENAGVFDFGVRGFGPQPPPFRLFFSRRIGLREGEEVPVIAGARLTGRVGGQTVGLMDVATGRADGARSTNYGIARVKRDVGESGYVGAMVTDLRRLGGTAEGGTGDGSAPDRNSAAGVDWSLWPSSRLNLRGFVAGSSTEGAGGDGIAWRGAADYTSDFLGFFAQHLSIDRETHAGMGFITRKDIHQTTGFLRLSPRPEALGLRKIDVGLSGDHVADAGWGIRDWTLGSFFSPEWDSGEGVRLFYDREFTRLREPFDVSGEVTVPPGDYHMWRTGVSGRTSDARPIWARARFELRRFYEGTLWTAGGSLTLSAGSHLGLTADYRHNRVETPWGDVSADVGSVRVEYAYSTDLTADALVQYNSLEDRIFTNVRVNLIHRPGSDLFVVFSEERGGTAAGEEVAPADPSLWDLGSRGLVAKVTYLVRL